MSLSGTIRRGDRQPLGSPEQVKTQLAKAFPGTQFILVRDGGFIRPSGFNLTSLLIRLFEPRYPYWEGNFEGDKFAVVFELGVEPVIKTVEFTLYGPGTLGADAHFASLSEQTGWQTKFPKF
jgi:hypothetical protein